MICVIDLSNTKNGAGKTVFFSEEFLSVLSSTYSQHTFLIINDEPGINTSTAGSNIHEFSISSNNNLWRKWIKRNTIKKEIEKNKPDVYLGAPSSQFAKKSRFCLLVSGAESIKALQKKKLLFKSYFTYDWFCYQQLISGKSINKQSVHFAPSVPPVHFRKFTIEEREKTKEQMSKGCEYFLIVNPVMNEALFVNLLKAFSIFKKRLQSSFKVIIEANRETVSSIILKRLATYKHNQDLLFAENQSSIYERASLTAAAYAAFITEILPNQSILPQEALACGVPVVVCAPSFKEQQTHSFIGSGSSADEIADIMMLLYKDEQYRRQVIQQGQEEFSSYSHHKNADLLVSCLQKAAQQ